MLSADLPPRAAWRRAPRAVLACLLLTCSGEPTAPAPDSVGSVQVVGPSTAFVGTTTSLRTRIRSVAGDSLSLPVAWQSNDTAVASVAANGAVVGRGVGSAEITATVEGVVGRHAMAIRLVPAVRVEVLPGSDSLFVGDSLTLQVTVYDSAGGVLTGRPVGWRSSDTAKAVVDGNGVVRTRRPGSVAVTATADGLVGGAFLMVQQRTATLTMPDSLSLTMSDRVVLLPDLRSASGTYLGGRAVTWTLSDSAVASVNADGLVTPRRLGATLLTAAAGALADSCRILVVPEPMTRLWVYPDEAVVRSWGDTLALVFHAHAWDRLQADVPDSVVSWRVLDSTFLRVAMLDARGRLLRATALRTGTTQVVATSGAFSDTVGVRVEFSAVRVEASPDSIRLAVGDSTSWRPSYYDQFGYPAPVVGIGGGPASSSITDTTVVSMSWNGQLTGRLPGTALVITRLYATADTVPVRVVPSGSPRLRWQPGADVPRSWSRSTRVLEMSPAGAWARVHVQSQDTMIATVDPTVIDGPAAAETVTVYARHAGTTHLMASGDSGYTTLVVVVSPDTMPIAVSISPRPSVLASGDSVRLRVATNGTGVPFPVGWESSAPAVASVAGNGTVRAVAEGEAVIRAIGTEATDSLRVVVPSVAAPEILGIAPDPLVAGEMATITGSGFDPAPAANAVTVDGRAALVLGASGTQLVARLASQPCAVTSLVTVHVESGGRHGAAAAPLVAAAQRTLPVGDFAGGAPGDGVCGEILADSGQYNMYILTIGNTDPDPSREVRVVLRGTAALPATGSTQAPAPPAAARTVMAGTPPGWLPSMDSLRLAARVHLRVLEEGRALVRRAGNPVPLLRAARRAGPQRSVTATINDRARIRIPRIDRPDFCATYTSIDARLVHVGAHVKIFEDVNAPLARTMDDHYGRLGAEFDSLTYPLIVAHFGDPTVLDSLLDGDGRLTMVFSPVINALGPAGFVVTCDFYPESVAPSSNTGEIFYAIVPTTQSPTFTDFSPSVWRWLIRSVVTHETKHLAAIAERLHRGLPIEDSWLEEAGAVVAEEIWARAFSRATWKGSANYQATLYCEVRPTTPACADRPYGMFNAFAYLYDWFADMEHRSPLGPVSGSDATFYGSGWSLLRWAIDQHATTEAAFTRGLTVRPATGLTNLASATGRPADAILTLWAAAMTADDVWSTTRPELAMPSWVLPAIFSGMTADFPGDFPEGYPQFPGRRRLLGDFTDMFALRGGSVGRLLFQGYPYGRQLLQLAPAQGGQLPSTIRLTYLRIQ